jgi:hypothetical protein
MRFKDWLFTEIAHVVFDQKPIRLRVNGIDRQVTGIDFKWEDFGQQKLATRHFVQEFPHDVGEPGQVFVFGSFWDGYWFEELNPGDLHRLRHSEKVFGDVEFRKLLFGKSPPLGPGKPPVAFDVNPLDQFTKIDPHNIRDHDGSPAKFRSPYDRKKTLSWWDFVEVVDGHDVVKHPARIR